MKNQPMTLQIPVDLHARAKAAAEADDRSLASLIRLALREYLGRREDPLLNAPPVGSDEESW